MNDVQMIHKSVGPQGPTDTRVVLQIRSDRNGLRANYIGLGVR